ncbi:hypothetical protein [Niastella koreensis]|nr:hypothetical protein [Niastella koreensis]
MRSNIRGLMHSSFFLFHLVAATFVWVFVWRHACKMDIVYDEASSFRLLKMGIYRALPGVANTHWLNSFFMRLTMTFNDSVVCLRLHSIIAFPFFAHGIYRLATHIKNSGAQLAFYCLAIFNPYVLDFFSLARGYGMAITFQAWTILFVIKAVQTEFNYRLWLRVVILSALTLGANLSYQYTVMAITGGYLIYNSFTDYFFSWYTNKQKRRITWLFVLMLFLATVDLLFIKYYGKDLEFGGRENFISSVFSSFWEYSLYNAGYISLSIWLGWCTLVLIIAASIYFIIKTVQQKKAGVGIIAAFITGGIFLLGIIFHLVFNTPFITGRTALQWYVPGLFTIFLFIGDWKLPAMKYRFICYGAGMVTGMLVIFHFATNHGSSRCLEYYIEDPTRQPLYDLYAQHPKHPAISFWIFGVYNDYYSLVDSLTPSAITFKEFSNRPLKSKDIQILNESDYIIVHTKTTTNYLDSAHISYTILKTYAGSEFKILKLNH